MDVYRKAQMMMICKNRKEIKGEAGSRARNEDEPTGRNGEGSEGRLWGRCRKTICCLLKASKNVETRWTDKSECKEHQSVRNSLVRQK
jgi:hypothetical protein